MGSFVVIHEVASGSFQNEVTCDNLGVIVIYLNEYLIEVLKLLGITSGLDGDIVVSDGCEHLESLGKSAAQLQIEIGVYGEILAVAKGDASRNRSTLLNILIIKNAL